MKFEQSAGGVIFKKEEPLMVLIARPTNHTTWVFPKGRIGDKIDGEGIEATALREVEEETGVKGEILHPLKPITFFYEWNGEKRKKTVYMYVMKYITGDISQHDWEMEAVEWVTIDEAHSRLTHKQSKVLLNEATEWISKHGGIALQEDDPYSK